MTAGPGRFRYAITQANTNSNPAGSQIQFDPTLFSNNMNPTPQTITVATPLTLTNQAGPVTITGPGANLLTISGGNTNPNMLAGTQVFNITNQSSANDVLYFPRLTSLSCRQGKQPLGDGPNFLLWK